MKKEVSIQCTPSELAEAFWDLGSIGQAEFFVSLDKCIEEYFERRGKSISCSDEQWIDVKAQLKKHPEGKRGVRVIRSIASWHYLYLLGFGDCDL